MSTPASIAHEPASVHTPDDAVVEPVLGSVTSADGTTIGYRRFGRGPGLVLLHGSMSSGAHHTELARVLADSFTVYVPDRRGRGLTGPYGGRDPLAEELEDLWALLVATGTSNVWGLSSGAIIALHAARTTPAIAKVALFEPPLFRDRAHLAAILAQFDDEMARDKVGDAMVTAMRGAEMGPGWMRALPKPLLARLVAMGMTQETRKPAGPYPTMRELAATLHADFAIVASSSGRLDDRAIGADTLLMGGSKSPAFLKRALADLSGVLPAARRDELEGLDHAASWNSDVRGHPELVAPELRRCFASRRLDDLSDHGIASRQPWPGAHDIARR
jgi:pimeloyl-ACP methyl ester carboxylesterase